MPSSTLTEFRPAVRRVLASAAAVVVEDVAGGRYALAPGAVIARSGDGLALLTSPLSDKVLWAWRSWRSARSDQKIHENFEQETLCKKCCSN